MPINDSKTLETQLQELGDPLVSMFKTANPEWFQPKIDTPVLKPVS